MTPRKRDDETGRYTEKYPPELFVDALRAGELDTPATTSEVAEHVGCDHDTAYKKLRAAEEQGGVASRKAGNTLLWSVSTDE